MRKATDARGKSAGAVSSDGDFDTVYLRHHGEVYRLLFRITGSAEESEDLAQETFLRFYRQGSEPGRVHNPRSWLFRVATNLAYNRLRDRRRGERREDVAGAMEETEAVPSADPAAGVERRFEVELVRKALGLLPERQSRLLLLRYTGLSYREVADVLGVAPGSVGTMLARAEDAFEDAVGRLEEAEGRGIGDDL